MGVKNCHFIAMFQFKCKKAAYYLEEQRLQQYKPVGDSLEQVTDRP